MKKYILEIIILTIDTPEVLQQCLDSVVNNTDLQTKVYIVNNGAKGKVVDLLSGYNGRSIRNIDFEVINLSKNIGAIHGRNIVLRKTVAPFVCFLDNDVIVSEHWAERAILVLQSNANLGFLGIKDLKPEINDNIDIVGKLKSLSNELFERYQITYKICHEVVSYCCFIKREVIDKLGCLDEEIQMVDFEDIDYSLRTRLLGYHCGIALGIGVYHHKNVTQNKIGSIKKSRNSYLYINERWYKRKWHQYNYLVHIDSPMKLLFEVAINLNLLHNFVSVYSDNHKNQKMVNFQKSKEECTKLYNLGIKYRLTPKIWFKDLGFLISVLLKSKKRFDCIFSENEIFLGFLKKFGIKTAYCLEKIDNINDEKLSRLLNKYSYIIVSSAIANFAPLNFKSRILTIDDFWRLKVKDFCSETDDFRKKLFRHSTYVLEK